MPSLPDHVLPHEASSPTLRGAALIVVVIAALALLVTSLGRGSVGSAGPDDPAAAPVLEAAAEV